MAVTYDTVASSDQESSPSSPITFSISLGSLTNGAVAVCIGNRTPGGGSLITISAVTVNGVSASLVSGTTSTGNPNCAAYIYAVALGTISGSKTVSVSWSAGSPDGVSVVAISASGVDQTTPIIHGANSQPGFGAAASLAITSATTNLAFDFIENRVNAINTPTQTIIAGTDGVTFYGSSNATTQASSVTFGWGASGWQTQTGADFLAAGAATSKLFRQSLINGLGAGGPFFNNPLD
jgi:hypothetical protein